MTLNRGEIRHGCKLYRLREFIRPEDQHGLIVDASGGLALGALPGLEDFGAAARSVLSVVDGLVCSPGQLRRISDRTRGEASLLVRMDWTNTLRGSDFVLPPASEQRVPLLTVQDALDLGATAMVHSFLLGYEEEVEAACLRHTVQWALEGNALGLPLIVEVHANGPRVSIAHKAVELGASYALEGGADAIAIPYPGRKSLETIAAMVSVPWLIKPSHSGEMRRCSGVGRSDRVGVRRAVARSHDLCLLDHGRRAAARICGAAASSRVKAGEAIYAQRIRRPHGTVVQSARRWPRSVRRRRSRLHERRDAECGEAAQSITEAVIRGGVDGILMSPGQAMRLAPLFQGRAGPALIVRADWMNMPRLGSANVTNAVPQRKLFHQKVLTAEQALSLGATAITIYLFLGYGDEVEAAGIDSCAKFAAECRKVGLPCIMEPLAVGGQVTGANVVEVLTLGARICVEIGADALKIPYTGDVDSFANLCRVSQVPVLVLGGARSDNERDALELFAEGLEAGCHGCLMGRNVTKSPDPEKLMRQLCQIAHEGYTVDEALRGERWNHLRLKAARANAPAASYASRPASARTTAANSARTWHGCTSIR